MFVMRVREKEMPTIESLANGIRLLEAVAEAGAPESTPELIKKCESFMTASQVRNSADTLAELGWLQKMPGKGNVAVYGLGSKAARLWAIYVGKRLDDLQDQNHSQAEELGRLKRLVECGEE